MKISLTLLLFASIAQRYLAKPDLTMIYCRSSELNRLNQLICRWCQYSVLNIPQLSQCDGSLAGIDYCLKNTKITEDGPVICELCQFGYHPSEDLRACTPCPNGCRECDKDGVCLSTYFGHDPDTENLPENKEILKECDVYKKDPLTKKVYCIICSDKSILDDNKCRIDQNHGTDDADRCFKYSYNRCSVCKEGFNMLEGGKCYSFNEYNELRNGSTFEWSSLI